MTLARAAHLGLRSRRGFGTFLAILLLLIVAATLPVLASVFAADAKRTRTQSEDAQLRQLLAAGAVFAKGQATAGAAGEAEAAATTRLAAAALDVRLPQELSDAGASVTCSSTRVDGDHVASTIHARLRSRSMEQTLSFQRRDDGTWHAVGATLNRD